MPLKHFPHIFPFLLMGFLLARAQYPPDFPYQTYPAGSVPALPPLNGSITDTMLPAPVQITRITGYVPQWDWYPHHEYAKIQPWNANSTYYKFYSVALYDAQTHQMIRELPGGQIWPSYWSNTDPDLIYSFRENGDIKTYSVSRDTIMLLDQIFADPVTQTRYDVVKLGPGEGNIDIHDRYVALVGKKADDLEVIIYDLQNLQIITRKNFPGAWGNGSADYPYYIDWVSVSQSGNYVGIMWDHNHTSQSHPHAGHYGVEIYRTSDMHFLRRIADYGNHGDFGYSASGEEVFVQFWGTSGTLNMYYLDRTENLILSHHPDFSHGGHISCRNFLRPGWAYVSQDEGDARVMLAVKLDGSGLVEYFGHHFSTSANYLKSPMPVPNPTGEMIMFKSDFGDNNTDVVYTFITNTDNQQDISNIKQKSATITPYPVPVVSAFRMKGLNKPVAYQIFDLSGKKLDDGKILPGTDISMGQFLPGVYILKLNDGMNDAYTIKIIKK